MPAHPNTHTSTAVQALPAPVVVMQAMMAKSSLIRASWRHAGAQASRQPPLIPKGSLGGLKYTAKNLLIYQPLFSTRFSLKTGLLSQPRAGVENTGRQLPGDV